MVKKFTLAFLYLPWIILWLFTFFIPYLYTLYIFFSSGPDWNFCREKYFCYPPCFTWGQILNYIQKCTAFFSWTVFFKLTYVWQLFLLALCDYFMSTRYQQQLFCDHDKCSWGFFRILFTFFIRLFKLPYLFFVTIIFVCK